ncbi:putative RNA methyltransferase [Allosalinactinospora lopnorensis]|uniref:putative RNA methyltransferase n=1 Tax=Allosalinactinospora lopnorensis TaxID=1352348 RepID=UPI001568EEF9
MPARALAALACPHCGQGLAPVGDALACPAGHSFDVARQGYVSLLSGRRTGPGDSRDMVRARQEFQEAGHYAPLARRLAATVADLAPEPELVADVGAGTGYYLRHVLDALPGSHGLALDVSGYALRRAAKAHPRAGALACDVWGGLPLRRGAAAVLLNVFAPRNGAEFRRVLSDDGALLVVTPTARHLAELRGPLGLIDVDPRKDERVPEGLAPHLLPERHEETSAELRLGRTEVGALVEMGPSARHIDPAELRRRVAALPGATDVTASWTISVYRPA